MKKSFVIFACAIFLLGGGYSYGQHLDSANLAVVYRVGQAAEVNVNGRYIVTLRSFLLATSPQQRATTTSERLEALLRANYVGNVSYRKLSDGLVVDVDGAPMIYLTPNDIDTSKRENLDSVTAQVAVRLGAVLKEAKELSDPTALIKAVLFALGATVLFVVLLRLLIIGYRRMHAWIHRTIKRKAETSRVAGIVSGAESNIIFLVVDRILQIVGWSVALLLSYVWVTYVLEQFPVTRPWSEGMASSVLGAIRWVLGGVVTALPGLATIAVIMIVTNGITKVVGFLLRRIESGDVAISWIDADTVVPTKRIIVVAIWLFALVFSYPYLPGSDSEAFKGVSVLVGLMLSFGTTGVVGQAASGFILMYSRVIRVGEFVKIAEHLGTVRRIGFFNTILYNPYLEAVSVPNSVILASTVTNYSRLSESGLSYSTTITIGYDTPWRLVQQMMMMAAERTPGIAGSPEPFVTQTALNDFYVEYKLTAVILDPSKRRVTISALHGNIQDVFNENDQQIMSPHYIADPSAPKVVPPKNWDPPIAHT